MAAPDAGRRMQIVIDCADPDALSAFWAEVLGYEIPPPPDGHATWEDWYRAVGVPEEELDAGNDRLADPAGVGPTMWFQQVPEPKTVKNRLHIDVRVTAGRSVTVAERRPVVTAEADRLVALGAAVVHVHNEETEGHFAITLQDPEGNEFCLT